MDEDYKIEDEFTEEERAWINDTSHKIKHEIAKRFMKKEPQKQQIL